MDILKTILCLGMIVIVYLLAYAHGGTDKAREQWEERNKK